MLYTEISRELGVGDGMTAAVIGPDKENACFLSPRLEGRGISNTVFIPSGEGVYDAVRGLNTDIVIILECADKDKLQSALRASRIKGVWNMTQSDFELDVPTVNLPIGDILSSLMYEIKQKTKGEG